MRHAETIENRVLVHVSKCMETCTVDYHSKVSKEAWSVRNMVPSMFWGMRKSKEHEKEATTTIIKF